MDMIFKGLLILQIKKLETPAQDEGKDIINQMNSALGGAVDSGSKPQGVITKNNGVPTTPAANPASLTGANSEPVREMANELGVNNRVTNKKNVMNKLSFLSKINPFGKKK